MTHLYDKNLKFLMTMNYVYEDFIKEPSKFYPEWQSSFYATQDKYNNPILSDGALREKTREELILIDNKLKLLQDGEYVEQGKIIVVPVPDNLLRKVWDNVTHTWKEGATEEEIKADYFGKINKYKSEILKNGFNFNGHQQKCREKDLALLGNAIAANEDAVTFSAIPVTHWSFNDHDVVPMSLDELKQLRIAGATFVQTIFTVEAQLKSSNPNILLKKEEFIKKVDELSTVKCFKSLV